MQHIYIKENYYSQMSSQNRSRFGNCDKSMDDLRGYPTADARSGKATAKVSREGSALIRRVDNLAATWTWSQTQNVQSQKAYHVCVYMCLGFTNTRKKDQINIF